MKVELSVQTIGRESNEDTIKALCTHGGKKSPTKELNPLFLAC